jgi:hypothetical protein
MWRNATGKIEVNNGVRIVTDKDLCKYYQWFIFREYNVKTQLPAHGAHITIVNPKIHKHEDLNLVIDYHGREVEFFYDPEKLYISPVNYWLPAQCSIDHEIKWLLAVENNYSARNDIKYWGLHLTIANTKFNGSKN